MQHIQVIERAIRVLEIVAEKPDEPRGLGEIAARAGVSAPTCARILATLAAGSYVDQAGRRQGYTLGPMAYALGARGPFRRDLVAAAEPVVQALAATTGETALLAILHRSRRFVVCRAEGGREVQVRADAVLAESVYPTATGRLLLADMDRDALDAFVASAGLPSREAWAEAATRAGLETELARVRAQAGPVVTCAREIVGIGARVRRDGRVAAGLGLYLPAHRFAGRHRSEILRAMRRGAAEIEVRLERRESESAGARGGAAGKESGR